MQQQPAGSGLSRAQTTRGKNRLAKAGKIGEALGRQTDNFLDRTGYADPPLSAGFALEFWVSRPRVKMSRHAAIPRAPQVWSMISVGATTRRAVRASPSGPFNSCGEDGANGGAGVSSESFAGGFWFGAAAADQGERAIAQVGQGDRGVAGADATGVRRRCRL